MDHYEYEQPQHPSFSTSASVRIDTPSQSGSLWTDKSTLSLLPSDDRLYRNAAFETLSKRFYFESFRPNQLEAIIATMSGRDVLALMPTGSGKSLCYQLPAICGVGKTKGVTFVICPLTSLMYDQVRALWSKDIDALEWNADSDSAVIQKRLKDINKPALVYVTPEKFKESKGLRNMLTDLYRQGLLARFVIDEAHLISAWGQDFRPAVCFHS